MPVNLLVADIPSLQTTEVVDTQVVATEDGENLVSPSRSSLHSMTSGDLGDISSLSKSSGEHSSGSFTRPTIPASMPSHTKTSPSASSSYDPQRQSIDSYIKKRESLVSTISTISEVSDVLRHQRTLSEEVAPGSPASEAAPLPQAVQQPPAGAEDAKTSEAVLSEALYSSFQSAKTETTKTSSSWSSFSCAQKPSKSLSSDPSVQVTSPSVVSPTSRVSFSSVEAPQRQSARESVESSRSRSLFSDRSRSSSGGKSGVLFSDTSSHHSTESSRRSEDGVFRIPSIPVADKVVC